MECALAMAVTAGRSAEKYATIRVIPIGRCLDLLHPDGRYPIGQDCGIYWRLTEPPERGAEAPDWFYVPSVSPLFDGERRRSYVMWKAIIAPLIAIEFTSGNGVEEQDATSPFASQDSKAGKFWVYEQAMHIPFYVIYEVEKAAVEVYELIGGRYQRCFPNQRGHYPIGPMGVELGIWSGEYLNQTFPWWRWWDSQGNLRLSGEARAAVAEQKLAASDLQAAQLAAKLRELGINPDEV